MDTTDRSIVQLLRSNGRLSHEQIAREVHLSRPAIHDRIRRLEQEGVIRGYTASVDWEEIGLPLTAFIQIRTRGLCLPIAQQILALSSEAAMVEECYRVAGEWCLMVKTRSASAVALQELLDAITLVPGVYTTMTTVALSAVERTRNEAESSSGGSDRCSERSGS